MTKVPRSWLRALLRFVLVMGLGLAPWLPFARITVDAYRFTLGLVLAPLVSIQTSAGPVRGRLERNSAYVRDASSWDTQLLLDIPNVGKLDEVVLNLRRSSYIPLLGFIALILAAPGTWRRRSQTLALGAPLLFCYSVLCVCGTAHWLLLQIPGIAREASPLWREVIGLVYRALVVPESNRYIVPLFTASVLLVLSHGGQRQGLRGERS
ncbi:MAG: hypothetical protein RL701_1809 [Pseudomonadota bacterium]|jgi:hypothetical protein